MKLFLQSISNDKGMLTEEAWSAYMGACRYYWWINKKIKFKKIKITDIEKIKNSKNILPIGSIDFMKVYADKFNIKLPHITYDHQIFKNISLLEKEEIKQKKFPLFVKPYGIKKVNGEIYQNLEQFLENTKDIKENKFYINEELYDFILEFRVYVHKRKVKAICKYYGNDLYILPEKKIIDEIVEVSKHNTYSFDIGYCQKNMKWTPIEINDFWSLGNYGLNHQDYFLCLMDRWMEIVNQDNLT